MTVQSEQRTTNPEAAAIAARGVYRGALSGALTARKDIPQSFDAMDQRLVLQADFSERNRPVLADKAIYTFFGQVYSGRALGLGRVAFSQDHAAIEMLMETRLADKSILTLGLVIDLKGGIYSIGKAKPHEPLIQTDDQGNIQNTMHFSQPTFAPVEVIEGLTKLVRVTNQHPYSAVTSQED